MALKGKAAAGPEPWVGRRNCSPSPPSSARNVTTYNPQPDDNNVFTSTNLPHTTPLYTFKGIDLPSQHSFPITTLHSILDVPISSQRALEKLSSDAPTASRHQNKDRTSQQQPHERHNSSVSLPATSTIQSISARRANLSSRPIHWPCSDRRPHHLLTTGFVPRKIPNSTQQHRRSTSICVHLHLPSNLTTNTP